MIMCVEKNELCICFNLALIYGMKDTALGSS